MITPRRLAFLATVVLLLLGAIAAMGAGAALAADNAMCLSCHGAASTAPSQTIGTKTVSLFVDPAKFGSSTHGAQLCTACHGPYSDAHDKTKDLSL
ncbi:MAG: hypothetical protein WC709_10340 [Thermoleophilia bacterium]